MERDHRQALLVSVLTMLGLVIAANLVFSKSKLHDRMEREKRHTALPRLLAELPATPDLAFIGDSRVIHGVRPDVVEAVARDEAGLELTAVNLGLSGAPPVAMLGFAQRLLEKGAPKVVVLVLSHYMFSTAQDPQNAREPILATMKGSDVPTVLAAGLPIEDGGELLTASLFESLRFRRRILAGLFDGRAFEGPANIGADGWEPSGRVDAHEQQRRARARAGATRDVLDPKRGKLDEAQFGYLEAAIELLQGAGVKVVLAESPTATPIWQYLSDGNLYRPAEDRIVDIAKRYAIPWVRYREHNLVEDHYFSDGDHFAAEGATRFSILLTRSAVLPALGKSPLTARWAPLRPSPGCLVAFDFETQDPTQGWTVEGDAFTSGGLGKVPTLAVTGAQGAQSDIGGMVGYQLVNTATAASADRAKGTATSPPFTLSKPAMRLLVAGGRFPETARVELHVDGELVLSATGKQSEQLEPVTWDVSRWTGRPARVVIVDREVGPWGHLVVDQLELCDR